MASSREHEAASGWNRSDVPPFPFNSKQLGYLVANGYTTMPNIRPIEEFSFVVERVLFVPTDMVHRDDGQRVRRTQ